MSSMSLVLLPYPHLQASARCFDNVELIRQIGLCERVIERQKLVSSSTASLCELMWRGRGLFLSTYTDALRSEAQDRGYRTSRIMGVPEAFKHLVKEPAWFGDERVHLAHQGKLLLRNGGFYAKYNWKTSPLAGKLVVPRHVLETGPDPAKVADFSVYDCPGNTMPP